LSAVRLLGLDPGLRHTGWGVIDVDGNRLTPVAAGAVHSDGKAPLPTRLVELYRQLEEVLDRYRPDEAAVEETFVNKNPASTLKLGVARGVVLLAPARRGIRVAEYAANLVKKSVVGAGHADKAQVEMMVRRLLPGIEATADAADALAVAICHAHHAASQRAWGTLPAILPLPSGEREGPVAQRREGEGRGLRSVGLPAAGAAAPVPSPRPSPRRGEGTDLRAEAKRLPTPTETARARRLRRDATDCEQLLWRKLRAAQLDAVKFRRQEPILGFTVDFVAHSHRLIIELDGGQHADAAADERRARILEQAGFRVLRFWNSEVIENVDGVVERIQAALA
jgi:crossover junction endodeoxyribonuclease RuvC